MPARMTDFRPEFPDYIGSGVGADGYPGRGRPCRRRLQACRPNKSTRHISRYPPRRNGLLTIVRFTCNNRAYQGMLHARSKASPGGRVIAHVLMTNGSNTVPNGRSYDVFAETGNQTLAETGRVASERRACAHSCHRAFPKRGVLPLLTVGMSRGHGTAETCSRYRKKYDQSYSPHTVLVSKPSAELDAFLMPRH